MNVLLELFVSFALLIVQPRVLQVVLNTEMDRKVRTILLTNEFLDKRTNKQEKTTNDKNSLTSVSLIFQKVALSSTYPSLLFAVLSIFYEVTFIVSTVIFSDVLPPWLQTSFSYQWYDRSGTRQIHSGLCLFVCFAAEVKINT